MFAIAWPRAPSLQLSKDGSWSETVNNIFNLGKTQRVPGEVLDRLARAYPDAGMQLVAGTTCCIGGRRRLLAKGAAPVVLWVTGFWC
jgi:hypothetical protein